jgi:hypothetical protein
MVNPLFRGGWYNGMCDTRVSELLCRLRFKKLKLLNIMLKRKETSIPDVASSVHYHNATTKIPIISEF